MQYQSVEKLIWLVNQFLDHPDGLTRAEIDELWAEEDFRDEGPNQCKLPRTTFHRMVDAALDVFKIIIEYDYSSRKWVINDTSGIDENSVRKQLINILSLENMLKNDEDMRRRVVYEVLPYGREEVDKVVQAIKERRVISFTEKGVCYFKRLPMQFNPYGLKMFNHEWHVVGTYVVPDNVISRPVAYPLGLMENLTVESRKFQMPDDFDINAYFRDYVGKIALEDVPLEHVEIKCTRHAGAQLTFHPLHHSQTKIPSKYKNYMLLSFDLRPTESFFAELLKHGPDVEVLSPQWVRDKMHEKARALNKIYKK